MSMLNKQQRKPSHVRVVRRVAIMTVFGAMCATVMMVSGLGFVHGAVAAGVLLLIYSAPAMLFDWPRVTLADVIDFLTVFLRAVYDTFVGMMRAIADFFASLFDR